jgi:nitroreductase
MMPGGALREILDLARWAPSGDNTQVWRFEVLADDHVLVHTWDTRADTVYDLDGHPSQIAIGTLLETLSIAASAHGLRADVARRDSHEPHRYLFDVRFVPDASVVRSPLIDAIRTRTVQRRPMSTRPLTPEQKSALEQAIDPGYTLAWLESFAERVRAARLMYNNAHLRLTMPEAFEVHRRIIHWGVEKSPDRVPDKALGVDAATLRLMKWAMHSWRRMSVVNRAMGTWAPRLQMDFIPGVACAAHFVLKARTAPQTIDDYIDAGRAVQRFWLTLTHLGLYMQPEMTPLIFSKYVREQRAFTRQQRLHGLAAQLARESAALVFTDAQHPVYMGRVGAGPAPTARSERLPLDQLLKH